MNLWWSSTSLDTWIYKKYQRKISTWTLCIPPITMTTAVQRCVLYRHPNKAPILVWTPLGWCGLRTMNVSHRRGGGGTSLFKLYRYVSSQRVWFFSYFGLKTGIDFWPLWSKVGIIFKGTTRAYLTFQPKWITENFTNSWLEQWCEA